MYDESVDPQEYGRVFEHEDRHFWYRGLHALTLRVLRDVLARAASSSVAQPLVLDAGCGTGGLSRSMSSFARPVRLDSSPIALEYAARRGDLPSVRASVESLPFRDASFDAAVSLDVLYHSNVADDARALAEIARVVKPGGAILLNLPAHPWLASAHDRMIQGARRFSRRRVREIAAHAGVEVVRIGWWNSTLFPALAAWRRLRRESPADSDVSLPPAPVNALLSALLRFEARAFGIVPLPPGLSLFAVLRRPLRRSSG